MRAQYISPRPLSDFPNEAVECEQALRRLRAAGPLLIVRCSSLWSVCRKLHEARTDAPSYSSLRLIPQHLARLLRLSFGRDVDIYRTRWPDGGSVIGLTEDGQIALHLTYEYLASIEAPANSTA